MLHSTGLVFKSGIKVVYQELIFSREGQKECKGSLSNKNQIFFLQVLNAFHFKMPIIRNNIHNCIYIFVKIDNYLISSGYKLL